MVLTFISMIKNILKNNFWKTIPTPILSIFILSFLIRSFFVYQDFPFVLHPDEPTVVNSTINLRYNPNPQHFDWPTFYYYFTFPFFYTFEKFYFLLNDFKIINNLVIEQINYYIISRFLTVFFGAGTSVMVYYILKNLKVSREEALIGASIMALIPFHVTRSAQALTDVPMVFFAAVSIYFLTKIINDFNDKYFLISCLFAGLSVSTKYNGYMIFLSLGLFILVIKGFKISDYKLYIKAALVSFLGFFIGTPYSVFDYKTFLIADNPKGALWQFSNVGKVDFFQQIMNFNEYLSGRFLIDMGYLPAILSYLFIILFIINRGFLKQDNYFKFFSILIFQFLFIIWSVSGVKLQRIHYSMLAFLFLPIFSVLLFNLYLKSSKFLNLTYIFFVSISCYLLYIRIGTISLVEFYDRVSVQAPVNEFLILHNRTETGVILKKLRLPAEKISSSDLGKLNPKATHAVVTGDICLKDVPCDFELIERIESRSDSDIIYVYRKK